MNVRDLHEQLRTHFTCINGVPRAYMDIRCPLPDQQIHVARFVYQTVGVTMRGTPELAEEIMCGWLWQKLFVAFPKEQMEDHNVLIIFRRWPEVSNYIDNESHEATKLTMRLAIPGEDLLDIFGAAVREDGELLFRL